MFRLRTESLVDARSFARHWEEIRLLRMEAGLEGDVLLDPAHFLCTLDKTRRSCSVACWLEEKLVGVFYVTEFTLLGLRTGYGVGGDFAGRGLILCRSDLEAAVVESSIQHMASSGIHSLHLRLLPRTEVQPALRGMKLQCFDGLIPGDRMPLGQDFEMFLASLGKHTRRNIRNYTRKAASADISFAVLTQQEYQDGVARLNTDSSFRAEASRLARDERLLALHSGAKCFGLRAKDGTLVAVLCGFTIGTRFHLLTQLNDVNLAHFSLSLVLRGLTIQHLIALGHTELQFMGGASLSLGRFCNPENYRSMFVDKTVGAAAFAKRLACKWLMVGKPAAKPQQRIVGMICNGYLDRGQLLKRTVLAHAALAFSTEVKYEDQLISMKS
jgi:uncharacterized membrane protein